MGFYVEPLSIRHSYAGEWNGQGAVPELTSCSKSKHLTYDDIKASHQKVNIGKMVFSYGVEWRKSEVSWRWLEYVLLCIFICDGLNLLNVVLRLRHISGIRMTYVLLT